MIINKKYTYLFLVFILTLGFFAQTNTKQQIVICDSVYYSNPDSSLKIAEQLLQKAKNDGDELLQGLALRRIGRYNLLKSDLNSSLINLDAAILIFRKHNENEELGNALSLKAILFKRLKKEKEGIEFSLEALSIFKKINDRKGCIKVLLNLSNDYLEARLLSESQKSLNDVLAFKNSFRKVDFYFYHQNKGLLLAEMNYHKEALVDLNCALAVADSNAMIDSKATILKTIAEVYNETGDFESALKMLKKSEEVCLSNNLEHELVETYDVLIETYKLMGNYPLAFNLLKLQNDKKNEILSLEKLNKINLLEKKLLVSENEKRMEIEQIRTQRIQKQNTFLIVVIIGFIILLCALAYYYLKVIKLKNLSEEKSKIIEEKISELSTRQSEMKSSLNYAQKIQKALLPPDNYIKKLINKK